MLIAVLMVIAMVPMTVSAADTVDFTVDCQKEGYVFTAYELATLNTTTGAYTPTTGLDNSIKALITDATTTDTQKIIDACDKVTDASKLGTVVGTYTSKTAAQTFTVAGGLYYIKATTMPVTVKSVKNSILALPYFQNDAWVTTYPTIDLATKVNDGDIIVTKEIVDGLTTSHTTAGLGDTVKFQLSSTITGSTEMKLQNYVVTDIMSAGLTYAGDANLSVKLVDSNGVLGDKGLVAGVDYTVEQGYTTSKGVATTFGVKLSAALLNSDQFYGYTDVVVDYSATLNEDAVIGNPGNPNSDGLDYKNAQGVDDYKDGTEVVVYTFGLNVHKVDANDTTKGLAGAIFGAYSNNVLIAKAETDANGDAQFMILDAEGNITSNTYKFNAGTYQVKEIKAPSGYSLNSTVYDMTFAPTFNGDVLLTPDNGTLTLTVSNAKILLPVTGGMGTIAFTVVGAALIAFAGIMFVVLKKKKNAAK